MYLIISFSYCIMHLTSFYLMEVTHILIGWVLHLYAKHIHKWLSLAAPCVLSMLQMFLKAVLFDHFTSASSSILCHWHLEQTLVRLLMERRHLAHQSVIQLLISQILRLLILLHNSQISQFSSLRSIALAFTCQPLLAVVTVIMGGLQDCSGPIWSKAALLWTLLVRPYTLLSLLKTARVHSSQNINGKQELLDDDII